jgi:hypothetical protein
LVLPGAAVVAGVGGCNGGCWAGAGDGTGRLGGVGAGTGELLVPLLNGKLGGKAPGNSRFLDAGVEANITELASEPCNKKSYSEKGTPHKKIDTSSKRNQFILVIYRVKLKYNRVKRKI